LRNPPRSQPPPVWDLPSILGHAGDHQRSWHAYTGRSGYPVAFYRQLAGSANIAQAAAQPRGDLAHRQPALVSDHDRSS
jgi:hypothetical protein